jgi:chloramphenicol-sensitive protein RarD
VSEKRFGYGLAIGFGAYLIWGCFPLIIQMLAFANPFEVVVWRIVFGFLLAAVIITVVRSWSSIKATLGNRRTMFWIAVATLFIMINWQVYVIGVQQHHTVETALGYFINPLVTILLAVAFLKEKLRPLQWAAVALGFSAVLVLTFDYGRLPWIALVLAGSFGLYGLAKNRVGGQVPALHSFAIESGMLLPVAAIQAFVVAQVAGPLSFGTAGFWPTAGLIFFGLMTAIPLIMFGTAAKHLPLRYIGFLQYITPIMQFIIATTVFHEPMPPARWIGFIVVWASLVLLSTDALRHNRATARENA